MESHLPESHKDKNLNCEANIPNPHSDSKPLNRLKVLNLFIPTWLTSWTVPESEDWGMRSLPEEDTESPPVEQPEESAGSATDVPESPEKLRCWRSFPGFISWNNKILLTSTWEFSDIQCKVIMKAHICSNTILSSYNNETYWWFWEK